jgi:hypothetical protein
MPEISFRERREAATEFPGIRLLGSSVNKSGPEHVLYVVQAGPNSSTQRSYGPTLSYPWTGARLLYPAHDAGIGVFL